MPCLHNLMVALAASSMIGLAHAKACPPLGRVFPAPRSPSQNNAVQEAVSKLKSALNSTFSANLLTSGISVAVKSAHEDKLLFNYHYTPPVLSGIGTSVIDEHTIYRVGSVSKMMPALSALQSDQVDMHASVLKYLPGLAKTSGSPTSVDRIPWEAITVMDLATHLSGLPRDMAFDLALIQNGPWTEMGLPAVRNGTGPTCSGLPGTRKCTADDIINTINRKPLVEPPGATPLYSNLGYALLAMVVEAATGEKFDQLAQRGIFDAANMTSTSFNGPVERFPKDGFVPKGESTWNATLGIFEAAGGLFSNSIDMISFTETIITNKFLSPKKTRDWMKPAAHTSSMGMSVGAPWEILRSNTLTKDKRVIDVYTKSGDFGLYHALIGAVTDYDIVMTVLSGGDEVSLDPDTRTKIFSTVARSLVPAVDQAARDEASSSGGYVGTFTDKSTNSTLELGLDEGPGVVIKKLVVRGFDALSHMPNYSLGIANSNPSGARNMAVHGRMYPVDINGDAPSASTHARSITDADRCRNSTVTVWRAYFDTTTEEQSASKDDALFYADGSCETWFSLDQTSYNYLSLGEFVFAHDERGRVQAVRSPAFNVTLT
ncbi:Beta-lactamase/transpeptidase-like protein [Cordyceps fumosorosea ARSEF 2679]|uniref:Beta-lactamase/transpeptidase-like protein n=1 Tax=Cordyceps fumosorosea (strain ARSEF 2679) TaxID=1081104 RepID=A0A168EEV2_CORFA|nr:Beta-lactamase/transpeptidase-like protein [Cordyceps fumosorosea ARSEF 2679]OAA73728.1 Beta-lactamase/transpeptidase-like protein [Cordyceps fumosorosea ARSEF 2679]